MSVTQFRVCLMCDQRITLMDGRCVRVNGHQRWLCLPCAKRFFGSQGARSLAYLKVRSQLWNQND